MVYADEFASRAACLARERQLKPWTRAKKEALIAGDNDSSRICSADADAHDSF